MDILKKEKNKHWRVKMPSRITQISAEEMVYYTT